MSNNYVKRDSAYKWNLALLITDHMKNWKLDLAALMPKKINKQAEPVVQLHNQTPELEFK